MNPKKELEHSKRLNKEGAFKEGRSYNRDGSVIGKGQRPNHIGTKPKRKKDLSNFAKPLQVGKKPKRKKDLSKWSKPLPDLEKIIRQQSSGNYSKTYRD